MNLFYHHLGESGYVGDFIEGARGPDTGIGNQMVHCTQHQQETEQQQIVNNASSIIADLQLGRERDRFAHARMKVHYICRSARLSPRRRVSTGRRRRRRPAGRGRPASRAPGRRRRRPREPSSSAPPAPGTHLALRTGRPVPAQWRAASHVKHHHVYCQYSDTW